jgi:hypothetical protein
MTTRFTLAICSLLTLATVCPAAETSAAGPDAQLDRCNVTWISPSRDSSGSMPLGNGDIGLNVWVEPEGDLLCYLSKTDAWCGTGRLLKLGRLRVSIDPNPFGAGLAFRQTLRLREGEIEIVAGPEQQPVTLRIWADALRPVVHVEAEGGNALVMQVRLEVWRIEPRTLSGPERDSAYGMTGSPAPLVSGADTILPPRDGRITWFHRNQTSCYPTTLQVQALGDLVERFPDPLLGRTFGGCIAGADLVPADNQTLRSAQSGKRQQAAIYVHTAQTATPEAWVEELEKLVQAAGSVDLDRAREEHRRWWASFWDRSWIFADAPKVPQPSEPVTVNELPLRIGADSEGQNRFHGRLARASVLRRALPDAEVAQLAQAGRGQPLRGMDDLVASWRFDRATDGVFANSVGDSFSARIVGDVKLVEDDGQSLDFAGGGYLEIGHDPRLNLTAGFTLEAWIAPARLPGGGGRLIDKSKAATANGYLLDTYPGNSLRSIVQAGTLTHDAKLAPGQWVHVAATFDPAADRQCLYVQGRLVAERGNEQAEGEAQVDVAADVSPLTRGYVLQRFVNACGGRGAYPIKFNGSIFTVDAADGGRQYDADYRRWGGCYWFQNTRLPYWAMLHAGDFDLMQPLFRMYREALPLARERTRKYYGHGGAFFPETMYFWGTYNNDNYGWNRQGKPDGLTDNTYIRYYWDGALELTAMMLDYYAISGEERFVRETLVPLATDTLAFYEQHYPQRDAQGKIVFEPSQALETWQDATNPLPVVAGLRYVTQRLLSDVPAELAADARTQCQRLRELLPDLPVQTSDGQTRLLPAGRFERLANSENPELYAIFPYRLYGLGRPDPEIGRATFDARRVKRTGGWTQDPIQAALLGLTGTAAAYTYANFATKHEGSRFPAFWGPNFDWVPDQDHGGVAMIALQRMLMQCDGDRILLLPAWPREWNVDFRLCAPQRTTIRAVWREGKLATLEVTPSRRLQDVVLSETQGSNQKRSEP